MKIDKEIRQKEEDYWKSLKTQMKIAHAETNRQVWKKNRQLCKHRRRSSKFG